MYSDMVVYYLTKLLMLLIFEMIKNLEEHACVLLRMIDFKVYEIVPIVSFFSLLHDKPWSCIFVSLFANIIMTHD